MSKFSEIDHLFKGIRNATTIKDLDYAVQGIGAHEKNESYLNASKRFAADGYETLAEIYSQAHFKLMSLEK